MSSSETPVAVELSRKVPIDRIGPAWQTHRITAGPSERAALAARFDLMALDALEAEIRIRRVAGGSYIALEGHFSACLVQACIVSLQPLAARLRETFEMSFGPVGGEGRRQALELDLDPFIDEPDPVEGNEIDIGEAVAQHLALAIDPYPRAKDAEIPKAYTGLSEDDRKAGPFTALKERKERE